MKILAELEFNEDNLGPKWMNLDNLEILLYTEASTRRGLLKVVSFEEESPNKKLQTGACKDFKGCGLKFPAGDCPTVCQYFRGTAEL